MAYRLLLDYITTPAVPPAYVPQGGRARARRLLPIVRGRSHEPGWPQATPPAAPEFVAQPTGRRHRLLAPARGRSYEPPLGQSEAPPQVHRRARPLPRPRHGWATPPPVPTVAPAAPPWTPQGGRAMARRLLRVHRGCAFEPPWPQAAAPTAPEFVATPIRRHAPMLPRRRVRPVVVPTQQPWVHQPSRRLRRPLPYRPAHPTQAPVVVVPAVVPVFVAEPRRHRVRMLPSVRRRMCGFVPEGAAAPAEGPPGVHTAYDIMSTVAAGEVPVMASAGELASSRATAGEQASILVAGEVARNLTATGGPP